MNTPEYQAISRNRHNLERFLHSFFKEISARLRDNDYLTVAQHDVVVGSTSENGCSKLVEAVLESIKIDSVTSFVEFIEISKSCGNRFFRNFIEEKIEAKRKEVYRSLFECSSVASGQKYDVFISSGRDPAANLLVDEIHDHLSREGLKVFVDRTSLQPGDSWPAEIIQAVNTCKAFVAVLTKKYVKSIYCNGELYEAQALKKPIFPVVFESDWDKEAAGKPIEQELGMTQYAFLNPGRSERSTNLLQLVDSIKRRVDVDGSISSTATVSSQFSESVVQSSSDRSRPSNIPFARELKSHGLETEEITKLEENGIKSLDELKGLTDEDIKEIGLNVGERMRVRKLIYSLQSNGNTESSNSGRDLHPQTKSSQLVDFCKRKNLHYDNLDNEVSDDQIHNIYPLLEKWVQVAYRLGLKGRDIEAIEQKAVKDVKLMRLYTLQEWKNMGKINGTATYRVLLKALLPCNCISDEMIEVLEKALNDS